MTEINLASLRIVHRQPSEARELLQAALTTFEECGVAPGAAFAQLSLGRVHALERQWEQAERCWKKAEPHLPPPVAWITGVERCVALAERGRAEAARAAKRRDVL